MKRINRSNWGTIFLFPPRMGTYNTKDIFSNSGQSGRAASEIGQAPSNHTKRKTNSIYFLLVLISILLLWLKWIHLNNCKMRLWINLFSKEDRNPWHFLLYVLFLLNNSLAIYQEESNYIHLRNFLRDCILGLHSH